jgi:SAM-dependent methyltransferase
MTSLPRNTDKPTVEGFGREWTTFTQSAEAFTDADRRAMFDGYFAIFPWDRLPLNSTGADIGCGSGRWAMLVAPRVGHLHAVDPAADALAVARAAFIRRRCRRCRSQTVRSTSPMRLACCITCPTPPRRSATLPPS